MCFFVGHTAADLFRVPPDLATMFFDKTGMIPAIYNEGINYVTNHKLASGILKEISDSDDLERM
jgi:hypothetical protein